MRLIITVCDYNEKWLRVNSVTSELWRHWKSRIPSNNIKIEILHYKKLQEWTIQKRVAMVKAPLSAAWHWLTAAHAPVCDEVSSKKLCFLPSSYFLVNTNWSVIICCHYFPLIAQTMNHTRGPRTAVCRVHLGALVVFINSKVRHASTSKHSFRLSVGTLPHAEHSDGPSAPYWWPHSDFWLRGRLTTKTSASPPSQ